MSFTLRWTCSPGKTEKNARIRKGNPKQIRDWDDLVRPDVGKVVDKRGTHKMA
jgi:ABC-type sulfate transport system substrate-binding protein